MHMPSGKLARTGSEVQELVRKNEDCARQPTSQINISSQQNVKVSQCSQTDLQEEEEIALRCRPHTNGIYLDGVINNTEATFTLDTGASCTLLSIDVYNKIPDEEKPYLQETEIKITGADGAKLKCLGTGTFTIDFGSGNIEHPMVVADITDDILLGVDIIQREKIDLITSKGVLLHHDAKVPLKLEACGNRVRKILTEHDFVMPTMTECSETMKVAGSKKRQSEKGLLDEKNDGRTRPKLSKCHPPLT